MREILFRGKTESGKWVYGSLIKVGNFCCILQEDDGTIYDYPYLDKDLGTIDGDATPVDPATIGQFTGLFDKSGEEIFEGDIVEIVGEYRKFIDPGLEIYEVEWSKCLIGYNLNDIYDYEVIGNIYDNPELLEKEKPDAIHD